MTDLMEWLRAQLDEDERVAMAASGPKGRYRRWDLSEWHGSDGPWSLVGQGTADQPLALGHFTSHPIPTDQAEHIALHDPARVLRDVEATRRILDAFVQADEQGQHPRGEVFGYHATGLLIALKHFAAAYADRPGYLEEWRP